MTAKVLLWWMEPPRQGASRRRARRVDHLISFGISAVFGLGIAEQSGPTMRVPLGSGADFSLPAQLWQYGVWLLVFLVGGWIGAWITSFGGRAEVTMREDGIQWILGKVYRRFDPYAQMLRCELVRSNRDGVLLLRITMQPERPGEPSKVNDMAIPRHVDANRVRGILDSAGVATQGWSSD